MEDLPSDEPEFRVNSPASDIFIAAGPIDFLKSDDNIHLKWREPSYQMRSQEADNFLDAAVDRSRRDVDKHPESPRARTNLGVALMNADHVDEAIDEFETALRLDPSHYAALAHLVTARLRQGEFNQAEHLAGSLRQKFPADPVGPIMLACIAVRHGQPERAIAELEDAVRLDQKSPLSRYMLGMVLMECHQERKAIAQLKAAARLDQRSPVLQRGLGVAYAVHGDLKRAVRAFKTSLALDPYAVESVCGLAKILIEQGDTESAIQLLSDYPSRHGDVRAVQELLAHAYRTQQQFVEVRSHLLQALKSLEGDESPVAITERARLMNNVGVVEFLLHTDLKLVEKRFRKSIDLVPHPTAFRNLHEVCTQMNDTNSARRVIKEWLENCPEDDDARVLAAVNHAEDGDRERGIRELRELIKRGVVTPRVYSALGALLSDDESRLGEALSVLREAHDRFPEEASILNNLAYVHLMRGEPKEARKMLEHVRAEDRENSVYLTATWGLLKLWEGDLSEAVELYNSAANLASRLGRRKLGKTARQKMHLELSRHHLREGDRKHAAIEARKGLSISGNLKYRESLRHINDRLLTA